ncbi:MAG: LysM peptidoglycan-binding domain-containing protein [Trueperaceae bacterium]|nr:LysM peptidoglycan-binding domain-containing protein [Trueperaceae bacterium]MCW5818594.1 LysM peptidoglycan-binding domain-containing protein [Trueperaceae bacterium]
MRPSSLVRSVLAVVVLGTAAASAKTITVQPGDSLWALARRYDTTVADLIQLNGLSSDAIRPGQVLTVPGEDEEPAAQVKTVVVRAGDTLYDIALANDLSVADLIAFNDLDGTLIHPGQELRLATGDKAPEPLTVTVAAGDSLWALARRYDTTVAAIASANGLSSAATLRVGAILSIPGQYASASETDVGGPVPMQIVVGPGETLWSIAQRYDSTIAALKSANSLKGDTLYVGQQLRVLPGTDIEPTKAVLAVPAAPTTGDGTLMWPLIGSITSRFGYRQLRVSGSNFHTGIDIDGETGDPIRAAHAGTVTLSGWHGGYGNLVIVTSGNTEYYYGHASALKVEVGDEVAAGDVIALVGSTGNSTGSHLHFEIRVDGQMIDPLPRLDTYAGR